MYAISEETTDEDLPQVWAAIIARVNKKTNWNLNEKNVSSINQVILKINPGKEEKPEAHEKAKNVWKTTLVCVDRLGVFVQRFGAFAAQAASVVRFSLKTVDIRLSLYFRYSDQASNALMRSTSSFPLPNNTKRSFSTSPCSLKGCPSFWRT